MIRKLSLAQSLAKIEKSKKLPAKFPELWEKVRPFIVMISALPFIGKKVRPFVKAFIAAIDAFVEKGDI